MRYKKKSMITGFIIFGAILFLIVALYFSVVRTEPISIPEKQENSEIYNYVVSCMQDTMFKSIQLISLQGGYYDTSQLSPTLSQAVKLTDEIIVPSWFYYDNGVYSSSRVPLSKIKKNLEFITPILLRDCLGEFSTFPDYVIKYSKPIMQIDIKDNLISMDLTMPTYITKLPNGTTTELSEYHALLSVPFKKMYDTATSILDAEEKTRFIENHILNLISIYSGIDKPLPPLSHMELASNKFRYWTRSGVEEVLKKDILPLVSLLQVAGSKNFHPTIIDNRNTEEGSIKQGIYNSMSIQLGNELYDYSIDFTYPESPIKFSIGDSEVIMPKNMVPMKNFLLDAIGLSAYDYSFDYDLSFPVIVLLRKRNAYRNNDLTFNFAIEANIMNSIPRKGIMYKEKETNKAVGLAFQDPTYFSDKKVQINTYDAVTNKKIDSKIEYRCGDVVQLGESPYEGKLPYCMFNGVIVTKNDDYLNGVVEYNYDYPGEKLDIKMWPIKNIEVVPKLEDNEDMPKNYRTLVLARRIKDYPEEQDVPLIGIAQFNYNDKLDFKNYTTNETIRDISHNLSLAPGKYNLKVFSFIYDNIHIAKMEKKICPCVKILDKCMCEEKKVEYPEQNITMLPVSISSYNLTINPQNLYSSNKLIVYLPHKKAPENWDELQDFLKDSSFELFPTLRK